MTCSTTRWCVARVRKGANAGERRMPVVAKKLGEQVAAGELVVEIETDKAVVEVEAPCAGRLVQLLEVEGAVVKMGQQIAVIDPTGA